MTTLLVILHVLAAIAIIAFVLIQKGKGADMGMMGGSDSILGTGGANFLIKITAFAAVIFLATGLILAMVQTRAYTEGGSVMDSAEVPQQQQRAAD
ncbi:preprotein translocase subunit SecG [Desulfurispirillum indicum]|uniref:Protein-export membrane protein SecG n=1 Tax=Desulfurispirillum indicum (strain ATCC BAA-1389 / DSM 22839 / S5) TaxID=653733 RepID=E6W5F8_DESIS|nr:preprotein translocase subunit SecG [Desulfurispirillum indicum]ADU64889.1 preprotein translocase, SecG subunit [Desulfurispirillum indicum S5]UCZ56821.1 preprotein translocase subunit SecG [Desulfurispirillum indicum]